MNNIFLQPIATIYLPSPATDCLAEDEQNIADCEFNDVCDHMDDTDGASSLFARSPLGTALFAGAFAAAAVIVGVLAPALA